MYISEDFSAAINDLRNGGPGSLVRCNFGVGQPWPVGILANDIRNLTLPDCMFQWHRLGLPNTKGQPGFQTADLAIHSGRGFH